MLPKREEKGQFTIQCRGKRLKCVRVSHKKVTWHTKFSALPYGQIVSHLSKSVLLKKFGNLCKLQSYL